MSTTDPINSLAGSNGRSGGEIRMSEATATEERLDAEPRESRESIALGMRLRHLRQRTGQSIRHLSKQAGVAPSYISGVEAGRISPTIITLRKVLTALGTDLGSFFTDAEPSAEEYVFRHSGMHRVVDSQRRYEFALPRREDIHAEIVHETIHSHQMPPIETLASDMAGFVIDGELLLEVEGAVPVRVEPNDAFYIKSGVPVRGCSAVEGRTVHLITIYVPPRY